MQSEGFEGLGAATYLRLERRGDRLAFLFSRDGTRWEPAAEESFKFPHEIKGLPRKVKVGVVAEAGTNRTYEFEFDDFKLTPLGGAKP
ncbi:MAG: hypothetical protein U0797_23830 [Gemmataceae bacterium]